MFSYARLIAAVVATTAALGGGAVASSAAGDEPEDSAVGSALNQFPTPAGPGFAQLTVSARSGPVGENPRGSVHAVGTSGTPMGEFEVSGPVTCLRVEGNRAAIKYRFDQASGSAAPFLGGGVEVFVEDNGKARGSQPVDANAAGAPQTAGAFDVAATQCDDPNLAPYDTVESGDYRVKDRSFGAVTTP
jgi:hypothetical protein